MLVADILCQEFQISSVRPLCSVRVSLCSMTFPVSQVTLGIVPFGENTRANCRLSRLRDGVYILPLGDFAIHVCDLGERAPLFISLNLCSSAFFHLLLYDRGDPVNRPFGDEDLPDLALLFRASSMSVCPKAQAFPCLQFPLVWSLHIVFFFRTSPDMFAEVCTLLCGNGAASS